MDQQDILAKVGGEDAQVLHLNRIVGAFGEAVIRGRYAVISNVCKVLLVLVCLLTACTLCAGTVTYVYVDPLGTPLAEADGQGNVVATFDYSPYGSQKLGQPASGPGYSGHVNDTDTNLVYMQARYYDPITARFAGVDPIQPKSGSLFNFNRYAYANDNPYKYTDRDGRFAQLIWGAVAGAAVEVFIETAIQGKSLSEVNLTNVAIAAGAGAVTAGVGSVAALAAARGTITVGQAVARTAAVGAAVGSVSSVAQDVANGEQPSAAKAAAGAAFGAIGAGAGARMTLAPLATLETLGGKGLPTIGTHVADTTRSAITGKGGALVEGASSAAGSHASDAVGAALGVANDRVNDKIDKW